MAVNQVGPLDILEECSGSITGKELLSVSIKHPWKLPPIAVKPRIQKSVQDTQGSLVPEEELGCWQSCEIFGNTACPQCQQSQVQHNLMARNGLQINPLHISSNRAMVARLQQLLPTMPQVEINHKLASRQIAPNALAVEMSRRRKALREIRELKETNYGRQAVAWPQSDRFYANMDDLRRKIYLGVIPKSQGIRPKTSLMDRLFPAFISPKVLLQSTESKPLNKSSTTSYFEPPLLSLDSQNPPNSFFAGQKCNFQMPTPLPENPRYLSAIASQGPSRGVQGSSHSSRGLCGLGNRQASMLSNPFCRLDSEREPSSCSL